MLDSETETTFRIIFLFNCLLIIIFLFYKIKSWELSTDRISNLLTHSLVSFIPQKLSVIRCALLHQSFVKQIQLHWHIYYICIFSHKLPQWAIKRTRDKILEHSWIKHVNPKVSELFVAMPWGIAVFSYWFYGTVRSTCVTRKIPISASIFFLSYS